jgi:hypothetical protein
VVEAPAPPLGLIDRGPFVTPYQIVAVALRLFAVWLGLQALRTVPAFFTVSGFRSRGYVYMTFMLALTVVVILALWFFPRTIAGKLLPSREGQSALASTVTADTWLAMGCSLIGLWTLTTTIPRLVYDFFVLNSMSSYDDRSQLEHSVVYDLVELAIAVWLVLGGKGVKKVFWWAQNAGTRKTL